MDINKFKQMEPMKYLGGSTAKSKVEQYLSNPDSYKGWYAAVKVDGEYGRIIKDNEGNVLIQGRGKSRVTGEYVDKTAHLPHIVEEMKNFPNGTVLLGEFAFDIVKTSSQEVATIFRCLAPKAIQRQTKRKIKFYVFDVLAYNGTEVYQLTFAQRRAILKTILLEQKEPLATIMILEWIPAETALSKLDHILRAGGEGMMIMNGSQPYFPGSRRGTVSIKIKKEIGEMTLPVIDIVEPKREYTGKDPENWEYRDEGEPVTEYYYKGWKQGVVVDYNGRPVKVTSGISDADAKWLATPAAAEAIEAGLLFAEITAMETVQGANQELPSLRHPVVVRLREDG